jgi:hypothetical protein
MKVSEKINIPELNEGQDQIGFNSAEIMDKATVKILQRGTGGAVKSQKY